MGPEIEIVSGHTTRRIRLEGDRVTIGSAVENDIPLPDGTVSGLHAMFERFTAGWCVSDLGSSNGTWFNGERIWSTRRVRDGDEIRLGGVRLLFHDPSARSPSTQTEGVPPAVTARERDVLVSLCRPLLARDMFTEPASTRAVAADLFVSEAAVKQHLTNLFDKFAIPPEETNRRVRLANEALRRGAVTIADLHGSDPA